jgi:two-component system, NarL family, sensor histidine kinase DegS
MSDPYTPESMEMARAKADDPAARILDALEAERARLAREIHDGPAQAVANAIFHIDYAERAVGDDPAAIASELQTLRDRLRRELASVRGFLGQLRPPPLDAAGFDVAVAETADLLRSGTDITVTTELTASSAALDDRQRTVALRVVQEALQNVRKHARATAVTVRTDEADGTWMIQVLDDGHGFDIGSVASRGRRNFGLRFMRERAELIGARFDVRSRPDGGTVVRLAIPTGARTGAKENE